MNIPRDKAAAHDAALLDYLTKAGRATRAELNADLATRIGNPRAIESTLGRLSRARKIRRETPPGHRAVYALVPESERNAPTPSAVAQHLSNQVRERAKRGLLHYSRLANPAAAEGDCAVKIEAIVDDIVIAAEQGALAKILGQATEAQPMSAADFGLLGASGKAVRELPSTPLPGGTR